MSEHLAVAEGRSTPPDVESEAAAYLQGRMRLITGTLAVAITGIIVVDRIVDLIVHDWDLEHLHPLALSNFACLWAIACHVGLRRRRFSLAALRAFDVMLFLVVLAFWAAISLTARREDLYLYLAFLPMLVVARAVVVPSSGRRTFWLSLPAAPIAFVVLYRWGPVWEGYRFGAELTYWQLVQFLGIGLATLASRVNFSLRLQVHKAQRLGHYALEEKIGEGAMGRVYRATHALLKRPTAVKVLRPEITSPETLKRFEHEARQASRLTHPNAVSIFDYGLTADGLFYYAMELLDGADLDRIVERDGPLPPGRVIHALSQACGALDEAHENGLVHRDLKPANVMLCRRGRELDVVKVLDFGLVKDTRDAAASLTQAGMFVGTPATCAPETFSGGTIGPAADLYSLSVVGYYALTAKWPFDATAAAEFVSHHQHTEPIPPSKRNPAVPGDLEEILLRCLEKDPSKRPASAAALRDDLLRCEDAARWTQEDARKWWRSS